ncbi:hypothetical protein B0H12DRAFT_1112675 [Mycena haematopus]|nr:hypothetical protein B0H12DRAFT_1112675 [Mycena haematopus]
MAYTVFICFSCARVRGSPYAFLWDACALSGGRWCGVDFVHALPLLFPSLLLHSRRLFGFLVWCVFSLPQRKVCVRSVKVKVWEEVNGGAHRCYRFRPRVHSCVRACVQPQGIWNGGVDAIGETHTGGVVLSALLGCACVCIALIMVVRAAAHLGVWLPRGGDSGVRFLR